MRARITRFLIVAFWLVMTGWLVRYEAFPHLFARALVGYRGLLAQGPLLMDSWMLITFNDSPIGYSHSRVDMNERDPTEQYVMRNLVVLEMNVMGERQQVTVTADAALDALYNLQHFNFAMVSGRYAVRMDGRRHEENAFKVRVHSPGGTEWIRVEIPDDVILHSTLTETVLVDLAPGREIRMRTLDPVTMSVVDVVVRGLRRETIRHRGEDVETMVLAADYQGMQVLSWMGPDGTVLRQETPFGWVLEACAPEEAVAWKAGEGAGEDVLGAMAMPVKGVIENPRACRELRVRLNGLRLSPSDVESNRQTVELADASGMELRIVGAAIPEHGEPRGYAPTEIRRYLEPSTFIQSRHPDLVARAEKIVGDREDSLAAALAINRWVYQNVRKSSATSLPSALDVLKMMEGDCNEHTYLFAGLARAAGIPTRVLIGVVYLDGLFYYHAWPAVYVGDWLEMDPTIGQDAVDATHIFLMEGESGEQLKLLGVIGQVQAEIGGSVQCPVSSGREEPGSRAPSSP
ncbi:MAG: transglutaminase domain-containing protein [Kiritimatiellae bacterium]|nr:transglutaminase domain-containing protein [Kiritimatiellia bacterium]